MIKRSLTDINEQEAARAFSKQAAGFDAYDAGNAIIQYKRKRVRDQVARWLAPGSNVLELNAGTGEDASWFAMQGHHVHATDIAEGMQAALREKMVRLGLTDKVSQEICSFTALETLANRGPYDCIFSNFAGLNCTGELDKVLRSFSSLVKPGGMLTLVILPRFCLWEMLMVFKGKFRTAFRRFSGSKGARSHVEGHFFRCWYYQPSYVIRSLAGSFDLLDLEGLCTIVPPSYIEGFGEKYPKIYQVLRKAEDRWKGRWPFRVIGDYYIISFRRKEGLRAV